MMVDTWQAADGLPQNSSTAIVQTADGYVWIATEEGLARFDGVRFEVFDRDRVPELGSNTVNVLSEGREGALWIGTTEALVRMKDGRFAAWGHAEGLPAGAVLAMTEDGAGTVWVGTDGGGLAFLRPGGSFPSRFATASPATASGRSLRAATAPSGSGRARG